MTSLYLDEETRGIIVSALDGVLKQDLEYIVK